MKTQVTIPVFLTVDTAEPDARTAEKLVRELLGGPAARACGHATEIIIHDGRIAASARLHARVSLKRPPKLKAGKCRERATALRQIPI